MAVTTSTAQHLCGFNLNPPADLCMQRKRCFHTPIVRSTTQRVRITHFYPKISIYPHEQKHMLMGLSEQRVMLGCGAA
ncbi:hypothetical protein NHX12_030732 [Muraenolepis orangiensis]|uniref:Uncharacterized protein n=1 Tax=Muraenolepis orangiensis TaxID=630683 RepID=A0A9Q0ECC6_9TELE|nr:hypothetical protein NHX12_030732 [Muraenolepis orangiensis]